MKIEKGNRVKVEFTSESATQFSGEEIKGFGVVDRCEDGYVFGRLESGKPFMCLKSDCELLINSSLDYEQWVMDQDFYTNMRFIHGDNLFSKDGDVYRVLPVQIAHQVWVGKQSQYINLKTKLTSLIESWKGSIKDLDYTDDKHVINSVLGCVGDLEKALRGES